MIRLPWIISTVTLVADQLSKFFVTSFLTPGHSHPLLPPVLYLTYVQNTGAAFGLLKGRQVLFVLLAAVIIYWLVWELRRHATMAPVVRGGCALILGGALGNLIDRLRFGYVIDFIDVRVWPVFNIGDSAITIGVSLLIWHSLRRR